MSLKVIRVLSTIAFCLYAAALIVCVLSIPLYRSFIALIGVSADSLPPVVPIPQLISAGTSFCVSLALMIMTRKLRTNRASKVAVIVLSVITVIAPIICSFLSNVYSSYISHVFGMEAVASYSALSRALNLIIPLTGPAFVLMLLAMGGFFNRAGDLNPKADTVSENDWNSAS